MSKNKIAEKMFLKMKNLLTDEQQKIFSTHLRKVILKEKFDIKENRRFGNNKYKNQRKMDRQRARRFNNY